MASPEVESVCGKAGSIVSKISGPSAVAAVGAFVLSAAFYKAFQDPAGADFARNVALGGVGLGVASLVSALTGKDIKNPIALINGLKAADPRKVLQKTGELYGKDPGKAAKYIGDKLEGMTARQREAFSTYVRHEAKMSQFRSAAPSAEEAKVAKGRDVFRSVTMGVSMPRQRYGSDLKRG